MDAGEAAAERAHDAYEAQCIVEILKDRHSACCGDEVEHVYHSPTRDTHCRCRNCGGRCEALPGGVDDMSETSEVTNRLTRVDRIRLEIALLNDLNNVHTVGEIEQVLEQHDDLLGACERLVKALPVGEVELARQVWGNTNTRIVLEAIATAQAAIAKAGS